MWTTASQDVQLAPVFSIVVEPRALFRVAAQFAVRGRYLDSKIL